MRFNEIETDSEEGIYDDDEYLSTHQKEESDKIQEIKKLERNLLAVRNFVKKN